LINYCFVISILTSYFSLLIYVSESEYVAHQVLYKSSFEIIIVVEALIVRNPGIICSIGNIIAVIDGIRQVIRYSSSNIEHIAFSLSLGIERLSLNIIDHFNEVNLSELGKHSTVHRTRHKLIGLESLESTNDIIHDVQLIGVFEYVFMTFDSFHHPLL
jgi:hypothetical protein